MTLTEHRHLILQIEVGAEQWAIERPVGLLPLVLGVIQHIPISCLADRRCTNQTHAWTWSRNGACAAMIWRCCTELLLHLLTEYNTHLGIRHRNTHLFFSFSICCIDLLSVTSLPVLAEVERTWLSLVVTKSVRFRSWIWYLHYSCFLREFFCFGPILSGGAGQKVMDPCRI